MFWRTQKIYHPIFISENGHPELEARTAVHKNTRKYSIFTPKVKQRCALLGLAAAQLVLAIIASLGGDAALASVTHANITHVSTTHTRNAHASITHTSTQSSSSTAAANKPTSHSQSPSSSPKEHAELDQDHRELRSTTAHPLPADLSSGELLLKQAQGFESAQLINTQVDANIAGLVGQITYRQTFTNSSDQWLDAIYAFPLPENAAIKAMTLHIGERIIHGKIAEKQQARTLFEQARKQGKRAALTEQHRPNYFTQNLSNLAPGETVEVSLTYIQAIDYDSGSFSWQLPTTFTPRYTPEADALQTVKNASPASNEPMSIREDSPLTVNAASPWLFEAGASRLPRQAFGQPKQASSHALSLNISLDPGLPLQYIDALYHTLEITKSSPGNTHHAQVHSHAATYTIELKDKAVMDRDFVLQWQPVASAQPQAAIFEEVKGNGSREHYAMAMILPPNPAAGSAQASTSLDAIPRDIIFILDTSGSMQGSSIGQAKASLKLAVSRLKPDDRFNIIEFNTRHTATFSDLTPAAAGNIQFAQRWIDALAADGGTEMLPALNAAFGHSTHTERVQQVIFITDGAVSNEQQLLRAIHQQLGERRLFTVAIGSAPNNYFMRKAAEFGRGAFVKIGSAADVQTRMATLFTKLETPAARNLTIDWQQQAEQYPQKLPDVYQGAPVVVLARLSEQLEEITLTGETRQNPWQQQIVAVAKTQNAASAVPRATGIASLWARKKIMAVEDAHIRGDIDAAAAKQRITQLGLAHSLLTQHTSFIAVDATPQAIGQKLPRQPIPNLTPHGQTTKTLAYPQTATTAGLSFWLGLLLLMGYLFIRAMRDDDF